MKRNLTKITRGIDTYYLTKYNSYGIDAALDQYDNLWFKINGTWKEASDDPVDREVLM